MNEHSDNNASKILLASASSRRLDLLRQIGVTPHDVIPANIDETQHQHETPQKLVERLSEEKAKAVFQNNSGCFILAADTVVACGQIVLDKAENAKTATKHIKKLSGRRHQVYGGITLITPAGQILTRRCKTIVQFKPLSPQDIADYIASGEWEGKAGGYAIQGFAGSFVKYIRGSYSNVVGLSLYDTMGLLKRGGYMPQSKG